MKNWFPIIASQPFLTSWPDYGLFWSFHHKLVEQLGLVRPLPFIVGLSINDSRLSQLEVQWNLEHKRLPLWISLQFQHTNAIATTQFKLKDQNVTIIVCQTDNNSAPIGEGIEIHFFSVLLNIINDDIDDHDDINKNYGFTEDRIVGHMTTYV